MANEVPATRTPVSEFEAQRDITLALTESLNQIPPELLCNWFMALAWVETAHGQQVIQNNLGNVTAGASWSGNYWRPPWYPEPPPEKYKDLHARMLAGKAPSAFRAYPTALDGWKDFAREFLRRKPLVQAAMANDAEAFVRALVSTGYSSDYNANHVATFRSLVDGFRAQGFFAPFAGYPLPGYGQSASPSPAQQPTTPRSSGGVWLLAALFVAAGGTLFLLKGKKPWRVN